MKRDLFGKPVSTFPDHALGRGRPRLNRRDNSKTGMAGPGPAMTNHTQSKAHALLQAPRDQKLHDLVSAGVDPHYPCIAIHPRDRIFVHIAVAAEQLQAAVDDAVDQIGMPVFRHGR